MKITDYQCQNCDEIITVEKNRTLSDLEQPGAGPRWTGQLNLEQRVCPGEIVPGGECPKCGSLCSPVVNVVVEVQGGVVQAVYACGPMNVVVVNWDNSATRLNNVNGDFTQMPADTRAKVEEILT